MSVEKIISCLSEERRSDIQHVIDNYKVAINGLREKLFSDIHDCFQSDLISDNLEINQHDIYEWKVIAEISMLVITQPALLNSVHIKTENLTLNKNAELKKIGFKVDNGDWKCGLPNLEAVGCLLAIYSVLQQTWNKSHTTVTCPYCDTETNRLDSQCSACAEPMDSIINITTRIEAELRSHQDNHSQLAITPGLFAEPPKFNPANEKHSEVRDGFLAKFGKQTKTWMKSLKDRSISEENQSEGSGVICRSTRKENKTTKAMRKSSSSTLSGSFSQRKSDVEQIKFNPEKKRPEAELDMDDRKKKFSVDLLDSIMPWTSKTDNTLEWACEKCSYINMSAKRTCKVCQHKHSQQPKTEFKIKSDIKMDEGEGGSKKILSGGMMDHIWSRMKQEITKSEHTEEETSSIPQWICDKCSYVNESAKRTCKVCRHKQSLKEELPKKTELHNKHGKEMKIEVGAKEKECADDLKDGALSRKDKEIKQANGEKLSSTKWCCDKCSFVNQVIDDSCEVCQHRPEEKALMPPRQQYLYLPEPPKQQESPEPEIRNPEPEIRKERWLCKQCSMINDPGAFNCVICMYSYYQ